jgi:hypothetical protein
MYMLNIETELFDSLCFGQHLSEIEGKKEYLLFYFPTFVSSSLAFGSTHDCFLYRLSLYPPHVL